MAAAADRGTIIVCSHCGTKNRVRPVAQGSPSCSKCHQPLAWVITADQSSFVIETTASVPVLVDFWAPWCGPCRMISPVLEKLAAQYAGKLKVVKVNVDQNPALAQRFKAQSIPLLVLIERGKEVDRKVGALPKQQLIAWLEPKLKAGSR